MNNDNYEVEGVTERVVSQKKDAEMINQVAHGRLLTDPEYQDILNHFTDQVATFDKNGLPTFGSLSILASKTAFFVYDHPALVEMCDTAFATETMIGFSKDFFHELVHQEISDNKAGLNRRSVIPLIIHELEHIMRGHHGRMKWCPHEIANIAQDAIINGGIARFFGERGEQLGPVFENAIGVSKSEYEFFSGMSEDRAGHYYLALAKKKQSEQQNQPGQPGQNGKPSQGSQPGEPGQPGNDSQPGGPGSGSDANGKGKGSGSPSDGSANSAGTADGDSNDTAGKPTSIDKSDSGAKERDMSEASIAGLDGDQVDKHGVSNQELSKVLEENGLDKQRDNLGLPGADDDEAFTALTEAQRIKNQECVNESQALNQEYSRVTGRTAPGSHIDDAHSDAINKGKAPTIDWRTETMQASIKTDGLESKYTDDYSGDTAILLGEHGMEVHIGDEFMFTPERSWALVLLDTSGSMPKQLQSDFLAVVDDMIGDPGSSEGFEGVVLGSADTTSRGDFMLVTDENRDLLERVLTMGGGGTDFINPIKEGCKLAEEKEIDFSTIIYLTDMGAYIPQISDLPEECPPVVYVTTEVYFSALSDEELKKINDSGQVVSVSGEELASYYNEVDIGELQEQVDSNRSSYGLVR